MEVTRNLQDLLNEIRRKNAQIILIDGGDGSGKSALSTEIAQHLSAAHINLDDYLEKNRGNFVDFIKYDLLNKKIEESTPPIIAEKNEQHRMFCEAMSQIEGEEYEPEDSAIPKLTEELIRYHYEFTPQETADIIYERMH